MNCNFQKNAARPERIEAYALILALIWSLTLSASLMWNVYHTRQDILDLARTQARVAYQKDVVYRRWNAGHGGVYVPATAETPANPFLKVPERDLTTPSGRALTLINPAYMTRQVHELAAQASGLRGHITSLNPIRPQNAPDPWEIQALEAFYRGAKEISSIEQMEGQAYMRLMRPLPTEKGCLKCHAAQGYKLGDIRGVISVSLPMATLRLIERSHIRTLSLAHVLLWLTGLIGLGLGTRSLSRQVAERRHAEEVLRESEEKYRHVVENVNVGLLVLQDGKIAFANTGISRVLGYTPEELISLPDPFEIVYPDDREMVLERNIKRLQGEEVPETYPFRVLTKDGHAIWAESTSIQIVWKGRPATLHFYSDISERMRAEAALRASEERFKNMAELLPTVICEMDQNMRVTYINNLGFEIMGYSHEDLKAGVKGLDFLHPDDVAKADARFQKLMQNQAVDATEYRLITKDGDEITVVINSSPILKEGEAIGARSSITDITWRKNMESRLQQVHKLEAVATLAGGVAHQFNNALAVIEMGIDLSEEMLPADTELIDNMESIKDAAGRMVQLTSQLLAYAQLGKYQTKTISLVNFVKETLLLLQHTIGPHIRMETDLPGDTWDVKADLTQMQMVLSALLNNACEAIEGEGSIRISIKNKALDTAFANDHPGLEPGPHVCLAVEDNGHGMDAQTRDRLFEPFFTTKFLGRGLGMAAVYGIIQNHKGSVSVGSELSRGTTVRIYLPAGVQPGVGQPGLAVIEDPDALVKQDQKKKVDPPKDSGTILIVEDENLVLNLVRSIVERLGYRALGAMTGKQALNIAGTHDGDIDLVLLDIDLYDMRAEDIYKLIMEARPNLKVIAVSMHSMDGPTRKILDAGANGFIQKPYSIAALSEKLKEVMEE